MPQLRNAQTSDLLAEGPDPLDLVVVALEVGLEKVVFDDVGPAFDINAAVKAAEDRANPIDTSGFGNQKDIEHFEKINQEAADRQSKLKGPLTEAVGAVLEQGDPTAEPVLVVVQTGS